VCVCVYMYMYVCCIFTKVFNFCSSERASVRSVVSQLRLLAATSFCCKLTSAMYLLCILEWACTVRLGLHVKYLVHFLQ